MTFTPEEAAMKRNFLKQRQSLPLHLKVELSKNRIKQFYEHFDGNVYVSFSGGKDSTVLLHLVRSLYPEVPAVFVDTGLEYPEVRKFVKQTANTITIRPKITFKEVLEQYGYPVISKEVAKTIEESRRNPNGYTKKKFNSNSDYVKKYGSRYDLSKWIPLRDSDIKISSQCCNVMKKKPMKKYEKETGLRPIVATMAEESRMRRTGWLAHGCNAFDSKRPISKPMSFWTEQDVLIFIKNSNIEIADAYGEIVEVKKKSGCKLQCTGCARTGCVYCGFGAQNKNDNRFLTLAELDPKKYEYSMNGGQWVDNPKYDATAPEYDGAWKNWNPKKIWVPSKEGLGLKKVFDMFNELYQDCKIKYEPDNDFERQMTIDDYV